MSKHLELLHIHLTAALDLLTAIIEDRADDATSDGWNKATHTERRGTNHGPKARNNLPMTGIRATDEDQTA